MLWSTFEHVPGGVGKLKPPTAVFRNEPNAYFVEYGKNGGYLYIDWRSCGGRDGDIVAVRLSSADGSDASSSQVQLCRTLRESEQALAARPLASPPTGELDFTIAKGVAKVKFHICAAAENVEGKAFCLEFQHWDARKETRKGAACITQPFRCQSRNRDAKQPRSEELEQLMRRAKVAKDQLMHLPGEAVRSVMDSLATNVEHLEQIVQAANNRAEATRAARAARAAGTTSVEATATTRTDPLILPAGVDDSARHPSLCTESGNSSYRGDNSYYEASCSSSTSREEGGETPLQSEASPTTSDTEGEAAPESELDDTFRDLRDLFPELSELYALDEEESRSGYRGFTAVAAPDPLEKAEMLSDLIAALNCALVAKLKLKIAIAA